jgi:hypothetical protein
LKNKPEPSRAALQLKSQIFFALAVIFHRNVIFITFYPGALSGPIFFID